MNNAYGRCIAYIMRTLPSYEYSTSDFMAIDIDGIQSINYWNLNGIDLPSEEVLMSITHEEIDHASRQKFNLNDIKETIVLQSNNSIITAKQLINGIIEREQTGNGIWTLPTASEIILEIQRPKVNQVFSTIFNNNSVTKTATIVLGSGLTTKNKKFVLFDTMTLYFTIKSVDPVEIEVKKG